ncbi:DUF3987 domain-containing protein [Alicyclobacillus herbarius]|uniref:DUF3987 domain-containing protein n=1 Tax=Alicyclobacillus herbarius TaxID=122960 RepID=UPI000406D309|nr:DUF3987 domain-containing protein [Alicyclobacillus herbarius]
MSAKGGIARLAEYERRHGSGVVHRDDVMPLPRHDVPPFPVDVYPRPLQELVWETAESISCPPDYVAVPMLSVAGLCIGPSRVAEPKPDWQEGARIWTVVVGPSGRGKTPAIHKAIQPVEMIQRAYDEEFIREREMEARSGDSEGLTPKEIYTTNSTVEALLEILSENPTGILYYVEEFSGLSLSLNQYKGGRGSDKAVVLSLWSGEPVRYVRKSYRIYVRNPYLCITGGIQPSKLTGLAHEFSLHDGFAQRFLVSFPRPVPQRNAEAVVSDRSMNAWVDTCHYLHEVSRSVLTRPIVMQFCPSARERWREWRSKHIAEQNDPDLSDDLLSWYAKLDTYAIRLSLVVQCLMEATGEHRDLVINEEAVSNAIRLVEYFKSHTRLVYDQLTLPIRSDRVQRAVDWIRRHGGTADTRDIQRANVVGVRRASEARQLIMDIADHGYGVVSEGPRGALQITIISSPDIPT